MWFSFFIAIILVRMWSIRIGTWCRRVGAWWFSINSQFLIAVAWYVQDLDVVEQWARCGRFEGKSVSEAIPGYSKIDPNIPELCGYGRLVLGLTSQQATLLEPIATHVFNALMLPGTAEAIVQSSGPNDVSVVNLFPVRISNVTRLLLYIDFYLLRLALMDKSRSNISILVCSSPKRNPHRYNNTKFVVSVVAQARCNKLWSHQALCFIFVGNIF